MPPELTKLCINAIENCESIEGKLIYRVGFDSAMESWFLDCGHVIFPISNQEMALALLTELPKL